MSFTFERFSNNALSNLAIGISNSDTTVQIDDPTNFPSAPFRIIIEDEIIRVTARSGAIFTVTRGQESSTAVSHASGVRVVHIVTKDSFLNGAELNGVANVRLSFSAQQPNPPQGSGTTIYAVPYLGDKVALLDPLDSHWRINQVASGVPLGINGYGSGTMVDVFMYYHETTQAPKLEGTAWTNITTRSPSGELATVDGVTVRFDDPTRRYLGTVLMHETGYSLSTSRRRFLWNKNRTEQELYQPHLFTSYTYATNTIRNLNNSASERVEFIVGQSGEAPVNLTGCISVYSTTSGANQYVLGFGIDTSSSMNGRLLGAGWGTNSTAQLTAAHRDNPDKGYHYAQLLEKNAASITATVYGTSAGSYQGGIIGSLLG